MITQLNCKYFAVNMSVIKGKCEDYLKFSKSLTTAYRAAINFMRYERYFELIKTHNNKMLFVTIKML